MITLLFAVSYVPPTRLLGHLSTNAGHGLQILSVADWAMLLPAMLPTPTHVPLSYGTHTGKHSWLAISIWGLSMTCIKLSIALTLLRIQGKSTPWRIFLFSIMGVQVLYGVLNVFFNLLIACRPLSKAWDPLVDGVCVDFATMRLVSNIGSAVNITTDVLLSLAPGVFLRNLNRPLRERIFVCVLMGLGLFASVSSILKTVIVQKFGRFDIPDDFWAQGIAISTYTVLEQFTGLLAACVPAMKGIFQACLGRVGVSLTTSGSAARSRQGGGGGGYYGQRSAGTGMRSYVGSQRGLRYGGGKDNSIDEDEEKCLEMTVTRGATPRSEGSFGDYKGVTELESVHVRVYR